ncbi:MAG: response regulator [Syntrophobacteraceae bacterium]
MAQRILVVDDEESMRKMLELFLTREGYRVDTAEGVRTAVRAMEKNDYQLLLIDKNMPGIDGNEEGGMDLLHHVRSASLPCAVIMMTGKPSVETTLRAMEQGISCFIYKPFSLLELRRKLEKLLPPKTGKS